LGCSRGGGVTTLPPTADRLLALGNAYRNAVQRLGHPPKDFQELQPSLEGNASEEFLRSPTDGDPFVVMWGVDYDKLPPGRPTPFFVAAYEKKGAGGARYVLHFPLGVRVMSDEQLKKAPFPPGYAPPF
jgi:hypothetical protein